MKKLVALLLCLLMLLSVASCGYGAEFALPHFDGSDLSNGYDTDLLYKNNSDFWGGDSGVIWVSKEQNPEWGGYFYQYMSGCAGVANSVPSTENGETPPLEHANGRVPAYHGITAISRSKDLNDWQLCGQVDNGLAIRIELDEWLQTSLWAPEAIYDPVTDLYYMFFSAASKINDGSIPGANYSSSNYLYDRFYLGIAVSESPAGPFRLVDRTNFDAETGEFKTDENGEIIHCINPAFMLDKELDELFYTEEFKSRADFVNKDEDFSAIDINPVFDYDEEGNRVFYIYFVKHVSRNNTDGNQIWVIRMKDMVTPEYETITKCVPTFHGLTVRYKGEDDGSEFPADPNYPRHLDSSWETIFEDENGNKKEDLPASEQKNEWSVVEAPQMLTTTDKDGNKVYLVTYSPRGVGSGDYDVKWAYGYSPFGPFYKTVDNWTNTTLGVDATNNFMSNLGHVQFIEVEDEWWIAHWECPEPFTGGVNPGRIYALSSMSWQYEESLGINIPVANGPHLSLQRNPKVYSGYGNVAPEATITATNATGTKYLNDELVVTMKRYESRQLTITGNSTITMEFAEPKTVRGILIHNAYDFAESAYEYDNAFSNIKKISFVLAETPSWRTGSENVAVIQNLGFNTDYIGSGTLNYIQSAAAAVATFDEIKVSKIIIEVDIADKICKVPDSKNIKISEIEVLGK